MTYHPWSMFVSFNIESLQRAGVFDWSSTGTHTTGVILFTRNKAEDSYIQVAFNYGCPAYFHQKWYFFSAFLPQKWTFFQSSSKNPHKIQPKLKKSANLLFPKYILKNWFSTFWFTFSSSKNNCRLCDQKYSRYQLI